MLLNETFAISIDTTGPNVHRDRITNISVCLPDISETLNLKVHSVQSAKEQPGRVINSVSQKEALEKICKFIKDRKIIVGYDLEGDIAFLANTFDRVGIPMPNFQYLDISDLASSYLLDVHESSLEFLSTYYNLENLYPSGTKEISENIAKIFSKIYGDFMYNPFDKTFSEGLNRFLHFDVCLEEATEKQKNFLNKLLKKYNKQFDITNITKNEASRQISQLLEEQEER